MDQSLVVWQLYVSVVSVNEKIWKTAKIYIKLDLVYKKWVVQEVDYSWFEESNQMLLDETTRILKAGRSPTLM